MIKKEIGERIPGLKINGTPANYSVLNERSVRSSAGIMFLVGIITFLTVFYTKNFLVFDIVITGFMINFLILVLWGPKYSPISHIGKFLVKKQEPEWVGAIQKRFAWTLGLFMSIIVFSLVFIFGITGFVPMFLCGICLTLMWSECALGVCIGCNIYSFLSKKGIIKDKEKPACPGGACSIKRD